MEYHVQVYASDGTYLTSWDRQLIGNPSFSWRINGGISAMTVDLGKTWGTAGEPGDAAPQDDLALGNLVVFEEAATGNVLYSGEIQSYTFNMGLQTVSATLIPRSSELVDRFIEDITYEEVDPRDMMEDLVDQNYLPGITFDAASPLVGLPANFRFENMKVDQAFEIIRQLAGNNWYWVIDPTNELKIDTYDITTTPQHTLLIGKHVSERVQWTNSSMEQYSRVIVYGDVVPVDANSDVEARVEATAEVLGYDPEVDPMDYVYTNARIKDAAQARSIALSLLEFYNQTSLEAEIMVPDNGGNVAALGYDIATIRPGDTLQILHPDNIYYHTRYGEGVLWGSGELWGGPLFVRFQKPLIVSEITNYFTHLTVKLSKRLPNVPESLVSLNNRLTLEGSTT